MLFRSIYLGIGQNVPGQNPPGQNPPSPTPDTGSIKYTVQKGDSLWKIAQRYGTTVEAIKSLNGLTGDLLNIGQVLQIPASQTGPSIRYTVRPGDSLWLIAQRYNTTVDAIKKLNNLTSDILNIGQVLQIPAR